MKRTMMMSNLPQELVEEILSRVPLTSLKAVRSTCKKWNALTKDQRFTDIVNAATSGEREFLMIMDYEVYLIGVNLHGIQNNNVDLSIKLKGKLNGIDSSHKVFSRSQVCHCNGLLLFVLDTSFVVWNPYCGIPKCIKRPYKYVRETVALGYDKSCGSHKILRLYGKYLNNLEIYDLSSDSWMVPKVTLKWDIMSITHFGSLKGNSYWYAQDKESSDYFIFSFDFTRKIFGPRLDAPFNVYDDVSLSVVKEEQLAMLFKRWEDTFEMEIWVTNKIEPDALSWSRFLKFDMTLNLLNVDFLIDEEKKVAVVFDRVRAESSKLKFSYTYIAYIIGENNYLRRLDFVESLNISSWPLACPYVPSSVQIK